MRKSILKCHFIRLYMKTRIKYRHEHIEIFLLFKYHSNMNQKKSIFGDLCHQYRGRLHISEREMGKKIGESEYKIGKNPRNNKQPVISQFERILDHGNTKRKQHRDPPLEYVEACSKVFGLPASEKFGLFASAFLSSEEIVFKKKAIEGFLEPEIIDIFISLILSGSKIGQIMKTHEENKKKSLNYVSPNNIDEMKLLSVWDRFSESAKYFVESIKNSHFEYKV